MHARVLLDLYACGTLRRAVCARVIAWFLLKKALVGLWLIFGLLNVFFFLLLKKKKKRNDQEKVTSLGS